MQALYTYNLKEAVFTPFSDGTIHMDIYDEFDQLCTSINAITPAKAQAMIAALQKGIDTLDEQKRPQEAPGRHRGQTKGEQQ